ncbi:MAG: HesA/MoeB/ThiF family protein [Synergistes sp.]|nr:HesA/MoeB/ThiF family protein [Synergistes sp.]
MKLSKEQIRRYQRQVVIKDIGSDGQKKLLSSSVLVIGAGGLGCPSSVYLAAAGVGTIGIVDGDKVELSNLQRQILHRTEDIGRPKADSAREALLALNPEIKVNVCEEDATEENILSLIEGYDFVIDATDSFTSKFLISDACVIAGKPFSYGGIFRYFGQTMTYLPGKGPCCRCVFREPPTGDEAPTCREGGVIGAVTGIIGSIQAMEALKYLLGIGELLTGQMLTVDTLTMNVCKFHLPKRNADCAACGDHPSITFPQPGRGLL